MAEEIDKPKVEQQSPELQHRRDALRFCRAAVEAQLVAPATRKWVSDERVEKTKLDSATLDQLGYRIGPKYNANTAIRYVVRGSVDAQNGFGAMIRSVDLCQIKRVGDRWLEELVLIERLR
jgi:hypothetical protein